MPRLAIRDGSPPGTLRTNDAALGRRRVIWHDVEHEDCSGVIQSVAGGRDGVVRLEGGHEFASPRRDALESMEAMNAALDADSKSAGRLGPPAGNSTKPMEIVP